MPQSVADVLLDAESIALVGASRDAASVTARPVQYATKFGSRGAVTIVRPGGGDSSFGVPVVESVGDMAEPPDVVMVMVPADGVARVVEECAAAGARAAVVISSGFESGGAARRQEVQKVLSRHEDFRLIGPNCVGVMSPACNQWMTFSSVAAIERPVAGRLGLVTQSGAIGNAVLLALRERGTGVAHWFSTGDELDVGALEVAAGLLRRDDCDAVGLYLEGVTDVEHAVNLAEAVAETGKRVVAMRSATSDLGKRAAVGHTGRVVGDDEVGRALLRDVGVDVVESLEYLTEVLTFLSVVPPAMSARPRSVGILTVSGATGVMAADEVSRHPGLRLADFDEPQRLAIANATGTDAAEITNPLDVAVVTDSAVFESALKAVAADGEVDVTIAVASTLAHDYEALSRFPATAGVTVVTHLSPVERFTRDQAAQLVAHGIVPLQSPVAAVRAAAVWAGQPPQPRYSDGHKPGHKRGAGSHLGIQDSASRLGPRVASLLAPWRIVATVDEAEAFLAMHDDGIALKADGRSVEHRTDLGLVVVGLAHHDDVREAFPSLAAACREYDEAVVAQAMVGDGLEVMVSAMRDPEAGVVGILRVGGVLVEAGASSVVLTSVAPDRWADQLRGSALGPLLSGWRGRPEVDIAALVDVTAALVESVHRDPEIRLLECNPVIVHTEGVSLIDVVTFLDA